MKSTSIIFLAAISIATICNQISARTADAQSTSTHIIKELPLPTVPDSLTQPSDRADYIIKHFWDSLDFEKTASQFDDESLEQNFVNYINLFSHANASNLKGNIDTLMSAAENTPSLAKKLYNLADKYLATRESPFRNESYYIYFLQNEIKSQACGEAARERAKYRLQAALKNRPGSQAADFKFISRDGTSLTLSSLDCETPVLLMFYDPDCNHCSETIEEIKSLNLNNIKIVAIDSEDDRELWDTTKNAMPDSWTIGFALDPIQNNDIYIFEEMPTLFLLDKSKKIILKDASLSEIKGLCP